MTHSQPPQDSLVHDRAALRIAALVEPYADALMFIEQHSAGAPVVPPPSDAQRHLEGLIVSSLGHLSDPRRPRRPVEFFVPLRVAVDAEHYILTVRGAHVASSLHPLLPTWTRGAEEVESGIPGLRFADFGDGIGVTFYRLDEPGRFTVWGITLNDFEEYRRAVLSASDLVSVRRGDLLTPQERATTVRADETVVAASVVARRLGLLLRADIAIDSWRGDAGRFAVELMVPVGAPDPMPWLLEQMQSPHLEPRMRHDPYRLAGGHHVFSIDGVGAEVDIRMLRV
ncbi:MAG: hypothetical protein JST33_06430 [Actinobacteria bacterium]|nr:hypothetical protein [Actinomycetota bacterium]